MFRVRSQRLGSFHAILDELEDQPAEECFGSFQSLASRRVDDWPRSASVRLAVGELQTGRQHSAKRERAFRFFDDTTLDQQFADVRVCDEQHVASELGLGGRLKQSEIRSIRRAFAMRNHPDRVPAELRGRATQRMTIANALIDEALRSAERN